MEMKNQNLESVYQEASQKFFSQKQMIEGNPSLSAEGKINALEQVEQDFRNVWIGLEKSFSEQMGAIEAGLERLSTNPPARPTPSPEMIASASFEFERAMSALSVIGKDGDRLTEEFEKLSGKGNEAQRLAFVAYFSRFLDFVSKVWPEPDPENRELTSEIGKVTLLNRLNELYKITNESLKTPEERHFDEKLAELNKTKDDTQGQYVRVRNIFLRTGISLDGTPDPWRRKGIEED